MGFSQLPHLEPAIAFTPLLKASLQGKGIINHPMFSSNVDHVNCTYSVKVSRSQLSLYFIQARQCLCWHFYSISSVLEADRQVDSRYLQGNLKIVGYVWFQLLKPSFNFKQSKVSFYLKKRNIAREFPGNAFGIICI